MPEGLRHLPNKCWIMFLRKREIRANWIYWIELLKCQKHPASLRMLVKHGPWLYFLQCHETGTPQVWESPCGCLTPVTKGRAHGCRRLGSHRCFLLAAVFISSSSVVILIIIPLAGRYVIPRLVVDSDSRNKIVVTGYIVWLLATYMCEGMYWDVLERAGRLQCCVTCSCWWTQGGEQTSSSLQIKLCCGRKTSF